MCLNVESLSNIAKGELLARIAHRLTICAPDTYEVGTNDVLEPKVLRAYTELLHRVIGAMSYYLLIIKQTRLFPAIPSTDAGAFRRKT
jgi:hypothetical protein